MTNSKWALVPDTHKSAMHWDRLPDALRDAIADFGLWAFGAGSMPVGDIDEIRYDGRLVILDDGTRWAVESHECHTSDLWNALDKVVVIDGEMYNIEDAERVSVTEEFD